MSAISKINLPILICMAFVQNTANAEPPSPPPVQNQEGATSRVIESPTTTLAPAFSASIVRSSDSLKTKVRTEPTFTKMTGIPFGSYLLFPELALYLTNDNNIYEQPRNTSSDWITTLSPTLVAKSNWKKHALDFKAGANIDRYKQYTNENVDDYWLGADGHYDVTPGTNFFAGLLSSRDHEDRGSPNAIPGIEPTKYDTNEGYLGIDTQIGRVSVRAGVTHVQLDFHNPPGVVSPNTQDDRDHKIDSVGARISYSVTPTLKPFIQAASDERCYSQTADDLGYLRDSKGYRYAIGASYKPSAILEGEVYIGRMFQDYDDSRFKDMNRKYFGGELHWKPLVGTSISAFLDRSLEETTLTGASGYVDTMAGASIERSLSRDMLVNGGIYQVQSSYQGIKRTDYVTNATVGVKYYVSPVVYLGADYRLLNRISSVQDAYYMRNQVMVSLGYTPGRKRPALEESMSPWEKAMAAADHNAELHGNIIPKLIYFDYAQGVDQSSTNFLERYNYLDQSFGNNRRHGVIADVDLSLVYASDERDLMVLEREGYGENNQRTRLRINSESVGFNAYSSIFQSATGGIDFRFNPNAVVGGTDQNYSAVAGNVGESQHISQFNYDSIDTLYTVNRSETGASLMFKPVAFDKHGSVEVRYDSIVRAGNKMTNYVFPAVALSGGSGSTARELAQWRGYSQLIDEQSKRFTFNFALTPKELFRLNYEFSIDAFQNFTAPVSIATVSQWSGIQIGSGGGGVPFFNTSEAAGQPNVTLNFVADSTLITNSLNFSKQFSDTAVLSAGLSMARLKQDSYTSVQQISGYDDGKTGTDSGYLTGKFNLADITSIEAFARYSKRNNGSSYPVAGFYDPVSDTSYERMVTPRINSIETRTVGLEVHPYQKILKTSLTAGLVHEDKDRNLTYGIDPVLVPELMLYRDRSSADEIYLKLISRPAKHWMIRLTPSYIDSNKTGMVTEPEHAGQIKSLVTYSRPDWKELVASAYYNYKNKKNSLHGYSSYDQYAGFSEPQTQKVNSTSRSAGLNLNLVPREAVKINLGYAWNQMDLDAYYFTTNRVRFHYLNPTSATSAPPPPGYTIWPLDFLVLGNPDFKVDNHSVTAGAEWEGDKLILSGNYVLNMSEGHNADGLTVQLPEPDGRVDNQLHSLSIGLEYPTQRDISLQAGYTFDYYRDYAYPAMSGKLHTIMMGLNFRM